MLNWSTYLSPSSLQNKIFVCYLRGKLGCWMPFFNIIIIIIVMRKRCKVLFCTYFLYNFKNYVGLKLKYHKPLVASSLLLVTYGQSWVLPLWVILYFKSLKRPEVTSVIQQPNSGVCCCIITSINSHRRCLEQLGEVEWGKDHASPSLDHLISFIVAC